MTPTRAALTALATASPVAAAAALVAIGGWYAVDWATGIVAVDWAPAAATFAGALVGGLVAVAVARRQRSGSVGTSEAADLWSFTEKLIDRLNAEIVRISDKLGRAEERIAMLEQGRADDRERIAVLEQERRAGRDRVAALELEVAHLKGGQS